LLAAVGAV